MDVFATSPATMLRLSQNLLILVLTGLLVFYHLTMLYDLARGHGLSTDATYNAIQAGLRLAIIVSLTAVVFGKQEALWAMWISIGGLIATQYWAHYGGIVNDFSADRHPLSYLKGVIFPTLITAAFLYRRVAISPAQP